MISSSRQTSGGHMAQETWSHGRRERKVRNLFSIQFEGSFVNREQSWTQVCRSGVTSNDSNFLSRASDSRKGRLLLEG